MAAYQAEAKQQGLTLRGTVPTKDGAVLLLGPDEPAFWPVYEASDESNDGAPDPMDRWSKRVIGGLAASWGGTAQFPSDGPPFPPFISWAIASGRCWASPVGLLLHDEAGLWISFRGAVLLPGLTVDAPASPAPCLSCTDTPCLTACPVGALSGSGYDVSACKDHLNRPEGRPCLKGCLVRASCPVSTQMVRLPEQSAFHFAAFLRGT